MKTAASKGFNDNYLLFCNKYSFLFLVYMDKTIMFMIAYQK